MSEADGVALTQRDLLMEMREDIRGLKATVDAIGRDQALGVERRASMERSADGIFTRLDQHDRDLDDLGLGTQTPSSAEHVAPVPEGI